MLQVFYSVSDHFGRLCMKGLSKYDLSVDTRNSWVKKKHWTSVKQSSDAVRFFQIK